MELDEVKVVKDSGDVSCPASVIKKASLRDLFRYSTLSDRCLLMVGLLNAVLSALGFACAGVRETVSAQSCIRNRLFSTVGRPERPCTRQKARNPGLSWTQAATRRAGRTEARTRKPRQRRTRARARTRPR